MAHGGYHEAPISLPCSQWVPVGARATLFSSTRNQSLVPGMPANVIWFWLAGLHHVFLGYKQLHWIKLLMLIERSNSHGISFVLRGCKMWRHCSLSGKWTPLYVNSNSKCIIKLDHPGNAQGETHRRIPVLLGHTRPVIYHFPES